MIIKACVQHNREFSEKVGGHRRSLTVTQQPNHPLEATKPVHRESSENSQLICSSAFVFQVDAPPCKVLLTPAPALDLPH